MNSGATVLIVGGGGREHALARRLALSSQVGHVILAGANEGVDLSAEFRSRGRSGILGQDWQRWSWPLTQQLPQKFSELAERARHATVDLAVIGPDNPLAEGIVDAFKSYGLITFGPSALAAEIEASKAFAKDVMKSAGVPTAEYQIFDNIPAAQDFLRRANWPKGDERGGWVIKADGLALGKGVVVCQNHSQAQAAAAELFSLSGKLVIEQRLYGQELSWIALCDGTEQFALMEPARDYKTLLDGHQGPNTGGMGCYSPVPEYQQDRFYQQVAEEVFRPVLRELSRRGRPFCGALFAGLMVDPRDKKFNVLEFNARLGDPESQVLLPRIQGDLFDWLYASARGQLAQMPQKIPFISDCGVYVVATAPGYPQSPKKGLPVTGFDPSAAHIFSAGLKRNTATDAWETAGGRVLGVLGLGSSWSAAREQAYGLIQNIKYDGIHYRKDIAQDVG